MNLFSKVRDYLNNSKENTVSTGSRYTAPDTTAIPEEFANSDRSSSDNNTEHKAPATPVPKTRIYSLNLWTILLMLPRSLIIFIMIQAIFTRSQAVTDITLLCRDAAAHL